MHSSSLSLHPFSTTYMHSSSLSLHRTCCIFPRFAGPPSPNSRLSPTHLLQSPRIPCLAIAETLVNHPTVRIPFSCNVNAEKVCPVPHLQDYLQDLPQHTNPMKACINVSEEFWLKETDMVAQNVAFDLSKPSSLMQTYFHRAGPRFNVAFAPDTVKAAILTCGGLCPGFNVVVQEIVNCLWFQYGVRNIRGIRWGYKGFLSADSMELNPQLVKDWHNKGGTLLGTSRGGFDIEKIDDAIEKAGLNHIYVIGGDGALTGAWKIFQEVKKRGLKVCVVGIPKTIDDDLSITDRSFGFGTAVEAAQEAIRAAHTEAQSTNNAVELVKLLGRYAGHIAVSASLSNRDVDCCLIPEVPFYMEGPGGLVEFVEQRLAEKGHCVIVVAEGAGQNLIECSTNRREDERDLSGNLLPKDIGAWLENKLRQCMAEKDQDNVLAVKCIDPTFMLRAAPCNTADSFYCTLLAQSAIHGAMAGYTGFVAGSVNGYLCYMPLDMVASSQHLVDANSHIWEWVKCFNNQPNFS